jgi:hypothetical protein
MSGEGTLMAILASGLAACREAAAAAGTGDLALLGALFLAGLIGGATHCAGMCGPFVLGQAAVRLGAVPARHMSEFHRLTGAALMPYHLGRMTTYAVLGAMSAIVVSQISAIDGFGWLAGVLLLVAALVLAASGISRLGVVSARVAGRAHRFQLTAVIQLLARPFAAAPTGLRGYALGALLGFIPCGLIYAALAAAAATGNAGLGALAMAAFALGTVPALVVVGWLGQLAPLAWRGWLARGAPALLLVNAGLVAWLAWSAVG